MDSLGWRTIWNAFTALSLSVLVILLTSFRPETAVSWLAGAGISGFGAGTLWLTAGSYTRTAALISSGTGTRRTGAFFRAWLLVGRLAVMGLAVWLALKWQRLDFVVFAIGLSAFQASVTMLFILRHLFRAAASRGNLAVGE